MSYWFLSGSKLTFSNLILLWKEREREWENEKGRESGEKVGGHKERQ